ncbi:flagellar hook-basal body protein [Halalkalibacter hemicellulosilyticus]|uniref:Flagellar basal-body rod protein FlgF n=1 Tax=Halalkalibacter hemicellulosilyticusJCM 9152 TaxID=1236971 RepID=W4QI44_9BACI|nr:flagellar hook-basal body protein [Halalkalibacter hemicellulosilyticus]GAE31318.1 flagellar basal-body rod protein FlgF [Halalkalibacter hemicellulosilyticusJCM 9152]
MLRGLYGAAAGMVAQQNRQEMLSNNLANANTPGFKADQASLRSFPNMLLHAVDTQAMPGRRSYPIGELTTGVYLQERMPNFKQGDLVESRNATDIALLQGVLPENEDGREMALFYTIEHNEDEIRYSRNGNFTVDGEGFLTTAQGRYVLDVDGERIQVDNENFIVAPNGIVTNEAGAQVGQINVVVAEDPMLLVKEGDGLLRFTEEGELPSAVDDGEITYQLQQGFVERSNVDAGQTMTEMMTAYRAFEANQRVLQAYDQSLEKAVNEVGRIG